MKVFEVLERAFLRFRYPVSLPEEIARSLGVKLSNYLSFEDLVEQVCKTSPKHLIKFMEREIAEKMFQNAVKFERFSSKTVFSYYFSEGWVEFILQFDRESRLRRIYLLHRDIVSDQGVELRLFNALPARNHSI